MNRFRSKLVDSVDDHVGNRGSSRVNVSVDQKFEPVNAREELIHCVKVSSSIAVDNRLTG